jgi:peptidyl-dipeptidase Dcp
MRARTVLLLALVPLMASTVTDPAVAAPRPTAAAVATNPLTTPWSGPYGGVPPFDEGTPELYRAALEAGIAERSAEIAAIANQAGPATFANTILALERSGSMLRRVEPLYGVMTRSVNTDPYKALDKEMSPRLAAAEDAITFDPKLFARVAAVWEARAGAGLTPEQQRLVEKVYEDFVRAGAKLDPVQKARMGDINQELARLFTDFAQKVLADEDTWIVLTSEAELAGLSESVRGAAAAAATERGMPGKWLVVNTRSSVDPFLTSSTRRDLREKVWRAFTNRGDNGGANDTNATIARIVALRAERARILGYSSHAAWRMSDTMAKDPQKAVDLMMQVWTPAVRRAREEIADMQAIVDAEHGGFAIAAWDYLYYAEKVRKARYDVDDAEIKPYFELNNMIQAGFWCAERLYGISFTEITGTVPAFDPGVRVWEVKDIATGKHRGLFYGDYFARPGKRSGAWAGAYRIHETVDGVITPIVSNNNNFVRGAPGQPVLITLDDARTLFHEFGHALHALLSEVNYPTLASTPRDFVEYPSQLNEHWVLTRPVLDKFARHSVTGAAMPQALVDKIEASSTFNQGYATVSYLSSALVDMEMHTLPDGVVDPDTFERETLARLGVPPEVGMRHRLPQFNHLFTSDAYSAGYYSYLWSEVMDADTWKAFEEAGDPFDPATAARLRTYILAPGDSTDRAEAFRAFRGRDPDVTALLEKRGFPTH